MNANQQESYLKKVEKEQKKPRDERKRTPRKTDLSYLQKKNPS